MKKILMVILITTMFWGRAEAGGIPEGWHVPLFQWASLDIGAALGRTLEAAIGYFLADDTELVAELVYEDGEDGGSSGGGCSGGCGGVYGGAGSGCSTGLALSAVASAITDIPAETNAYPEDIKVKATSIDDLARFRMKDIVKERAALDQLSSEQWAVRYRAQQRAIQALTDALVMKKAYSELSSLAGGISGGDFSNYGNATSAVATKRLMLDALMALRKRVIAARVRARAELMEMNMESVAEEASILPAEDNTISSTAALGSVDVSVDQKTKEASGAVATSSDNATSSENTNTSNAE